MVAHSLWGVILSCILQLYTDPWPRREHEQQQMLPNVVPDPSGQAGRRPSRISRLCPLSANTIRQRAVKSLDESAKRLKAIEVKWCIHVYARKCTPTCMLQYYCIPKLLSHDHNNVHVTLAAGPSPHARVVGCCAAARQSQAARRTRRRSSKPCIWLNLE